MSSANVNEELLLMGDWAEELSLDDLIGDLVTNGNGVPDDLPSTIEIPNTNDSLSHTRVVSEDDLTDVNQEPKKSPSLSPYDSIKDLIKRKQQSNQDSADEEPIRKRARLQDECSALHLACAKRQVDLLEVARLLAEDPTPAGQSMSVTTTRTIYHRLHKRHEDQLTRAPYTYPLNLAIRNGASPATLQMLVEAAPAVLSKVDGAEKETSLALLLKYCPKDVATLDKMIMACPKSAAVVDAHINTPLHIACRSGACLNAVRHLVILYPEALAMVNRQDKLPVEVATETLCCEEAVAVYLWEETAAQTK